MEKSTDDQYQENSTEEHYLEPLPEDQPSAGGLWVEEDTAAHVLGRNLDTRMVESSTVVRSLGQVGGL